MRRWIALMAAATVAACSGQTAPAITPQGLHVSPPADLIVTAREAVHTANVAEVDPRSMTDADIRAVVGDGPRCSFAYSRSGRPVLAVGAPAGGGNASAVVKLNGRLAPLSSDSPGDATALAKGGRFVADGVRLDVRPFDPAAGGHSVKADMEFETDDGLLAGYVGWYRCAPRTG